MNWILLLQLFYVLLVIFVILRILYDTRSGTKILAYILLIILVPIGGIIFYFSFGINYRKRKLYSKKIIADEPLRKDIKNRLQLYRKKLVDLALLPQAHYNLSSFIDNTSGSPLTGNNEVELLLNGEEKFPKVLAAIEAAKSHIHLEYYIYEDDKTGNEIADLLIKKAQEGVEVRFLYDDFGSHDLGKKFIKKLEDAGVATAPFYKIKLYALANRLNYRNHRKIIVIDGERSFVGGINMSDKYRNDTKAKDGLYWRDTHLMLKGPASLYLQYLFLCDWNFCSKQQLEFGPKYFPEQPENKTIEKELLQIVPSGPDSNLPVIFYSLMQAIASAKEKIWITSPYFIPGESLMDALIIAAKSGVEVKLLVPGISDSKMVNAAARSYYSELLPHGVQIYLYNKGFVHAKTMIVDDNLAVIGSANMDYRSFDLNFEVNAVLFSENINKKLQKAFENDLKESSKIDSQQWLNRPKHLHLWEKFVRLLSPFL
ncbi:cardiolipin synthase [Marixanthomonas spongiae]|uniref:Cardiolipin synthase n=1 Tax=Marixanthomonas spongiae TaxID=2174845 RepID=A0A2U0HUX3_9FLAO|nr:cardiolipin synthase [Marixanthomonas spongiae]PVW12629.1 cardiolipin synthase [Marixanthomonas spongiae]